VIKTQAPQNRDRIWPGTTKHGRGFWHSGRVALSLAHTVRPGLVGVLARFGGSLPLTVVVPVPVERREGVHVYAGMVQK